MQPGTTISPLSRVGARAARALARHDQIRPGSPRAPVTPPRRHADAGFCHMSKSDGPPRKSGKVKGVRTPMTEIVAVAILVKATGESMIATERGKFERIAAEDIWHDHGPDQVSTI